MVQNKRKISLLVIGPTLILKNEDNILKLTSSDYKDIVLFEANQKAFERLRDAEYELFSRLSAKDNKVNLEKLKDNMLYPELLEISKIIKQNGKELSFKCTQNIINDYHDVFDLDNYFKINYNKYYYSRCLSYRKLGFVWFFAKKSSEEEEKFRDFLGVYAIRGSVLNFLSQNTIPERKGVSYKIIDELIKLAKREKRKYIVVPWPLEGMAYVLKKVGFIEYNTNKMTIERQFLWDIACTTNYYVYTIK